MPSNISLNTLFNHYISSYELTLSKSTLRSDILTYNKHIRDNLGLREIKDIKFLDIQLFCNGLIKRGYKIKTIKNILIRLRVVFKFALKLELISKNPCDLIELPKFDNRRYFDYPLCVQKAFIKAIITNQDPTADIFFFLLHGRRKSEVLSLKFKDINFTTRIYTIPFKINKAKRDMSYKLSDELYERLYKRYLDSNKNLDSYVFINPSTNNKFIDLRRSWRSLLKRNNLPLIRLHDIRHLIGTYCINHLNLPIEQVSFILGHTSITTTQKYITNNISTSKDVIESIISSI